MTDQSSLVHPTYRHIDRAVHIAGLPVAHWALLVLAGATAFGLAQVLPLSSTYRISIAVTIVGTPAALLLAVGGTDVRPLALVANAVRWRLGRKRFPAGPAPSANHN